MKIAVIGSGISGLSAAYYLSKKNSVDLFESESHFGGHSHTINISYQEKKQIAVDIGFIVFNEKTYPNLIEFFKENKIQVEKSNMSFSVTVKDTNIEYCGKGISGVFSNRKNILNPKFIKMFFEIINFYKKCANINILKLSKETLGDFLKKENLSDYFINYHIIPMVTAIWSMHPYEAKQMPLNFFINFFKNHGLFKLKNRTQWFTVSNRSKAYVDKVISQISGEYYKNYPINKISRNKDNLKVYYGAKNEFFNYDKVVIATHANDALSLIENSTKEEKTILSNFKYKKNLAVIHSDNSFMPKNKKAWSSWNSSILNNDIGKNSITYWLNLLQNLNIEKNIFFTSIILIILFLFFKSYFDKNTMKPEDFKDTSPTIKIEKYFEGHVKAWGLLQDRKGKVTRQFKAEMFGSFENNILTLEEEFFWTDGEKQKRVWNIEKIDEHNYVGTAADVIGKAKGFSYGSAFKFEYDLMVPIKGKNIKISFDDWIFKQDEEVAINRATLTKFGFKVGELTVFFKKN